MNGYQNIKIERTYLSDLFHFFSNNRFPTVHVFKNCRWYTFEALWLNLYIACSFLVLGLKDKIASSHVAKCQWSFNQAMSVSELVMVHCLEIYVYESF